MKLAYKFISLTFGFSALSVLLASSSFGTPATRWPVCAINVGGGPYSCSQMNSKASCYGCCTNYCSGSGAELSSCKQGCDIQFP